MNQDIPIPEDIFKRIYIDAKIRNAVAYAHECHSNGRFDYLCALAYSQRYIVTQDQINEAKAVLEKAKEEVFAKHSNDLLFVSMGMDYEPRYEDDPCNHRIRTEFLNKNGHRYFIEVGTAGPEGMHVDFSIDRDAEIKHEAERKALYQEYKKLDRNDPKWDEYRKKYLDSNTNVGYHFGGIESKSKDLKYTKQNILKLVNETYGCLFQNIVVDQRTIHCDDREIICYSPKEDRPATPKVIASKQQQLEMFTNLF